MRSGSSLLGDILRQSNDALYVFEPVHVLGTPMMVNKTAEKNLVYVNGTIRYRIIPSVCVCACVRACVCVCVCVCVSGKRVQISIDFIYCLRLLYWVPMTYMYMSILAEWFRKKYIFQGLGCRVTVNSPLALKIRSHMFGPRLLQFVGWTFKAWSRPHMIWHKLVTKFHFTSCFEYWTYGYRNLSLWNIDKHCEIRSNTTERDVWSDSTVYADIKVILKFGWNCETTQQPLNRNGFSNW